MVARWAPALLLALPLLAVPAPACERAADSSRLAVAGGSLAEIIYFLGGERRIVAADSTSVYPPAARGHPSLGYVRALSTEGVLSVRPSLLLGEDDMGPPQMLRQIAAAGVPVVRVPEQQSASGILAKVRCVAAVLGMAGAAERRIAEQLAPQAQELQELVSGNGGLRVALLLGLDSGLRVAGAGTSGHSFIRMLGARNAFAGLGGWKELSAEAMLRAEPHLIVVAGHGPDPDATVARALRHPALAASGAARRGRLHGVHSMAALGFAPRTLELALGLARVMEGDAN